MPTTPFDFSFADIPDQRGRTIVITGATSGLGFVAARELAKAGAHIIIGARNRDKAAHVAAALAGRGSVEIRPLDTASLDSIAAFAHDVLSEGPRIGALINNAGVSVARFDKGVDGTELTWATNVVGPAALAERLLPAMTGTDPRIVLVGSNLSQRTTAVPDLSGIDDASAFAQLGTYRSSKTAAAAVAVDLTDRLEATGSPIRSVIAHPGVAATAMNQQATTPMSRVTARAVDALLARTPDDAARSIVWAAVAPDVPQRTFIGPRLRRGDHRLHTVPVRGAAADPEFRAQVRNFVAQRTGLTVP
ncbi:SDR family NAD(P)-dependent oxidoreductase [Spelaeicoccus albus]|uniref:NAD(P)-dependent dehydrogenase (Short-subunit alcohol dehydrogenase family) n=1 Tax=Spelaeicoccus albus TaxID=1280376 RepID=A0A7Z0IJC2_9MICO|nr:SDR family NAD(P)-dependent oxidoreductase [Spelaeicoccus albus]NYI69363.1 NAD(P)-dependent dehydrogenase (short-subunit alcohol dehydrogenase family) [Spelaeicoccus albus]